MKDNPFQKLMFRPMEIDKICTLWQQHANSSQLQPISLAFGQSNFPVWEYADLTLQAEEIEQVVGYGDIRGQISLREKISHFYETVLGVHVSPKQILITDGATSALVLALGIFVTPSKEVIVPEVAYSSYARVINLFKGKPVWAPLDENFNLDSDRLSDLITDKTVAIICNSPGNPHGNISSLELLAEVASLGVPVIFDEVYQCTTFTDTFAPSALQLLGEHFIINGFAKSFAVPGLRMGFAIVPSCYIEAAENLKVLLNLCPNLPGQLLVERLLAQSKIVLNAHRHYLHSCRDNFLKVSSHHMLPLLNYPQAGFYGIIALPKHIDSMTAAEILAVDYAIATVPGTDFSEQDPHFLRINFTGNMADVDEALLRIAQGLQKMAS